MAKKKDAHKCPKCKATWSGDCTDPDCKVPHTCPECGEPIEKAKPRLKGQIAGEKK